MTSAAPPIWLGVSLKMYLRPRATLAWSRRVREIAGRDPAVVAGRVRLVVLPSVVMVRDVVEIMAGTSVEVGGQNLSTEDSGPFTGEVSGADLAESGCRYVAVGHVERRRLYGETNEVIGQKVSVAVRHGLAPVVCVGEEEPGDSAQVAEQVSGQVASAVGVGFDAMSVRPLVVAYEPIWAIGRAAPADPSYIADVCAGVRARLAGCRTPFQLVYGGSAGPGLFGRLAGSVDGLFLGRFAHDPDALRSILSDVDHATR